MGSISKSTPLKALKQVLEWAKQHGASMGYALPAPTPTAAGGRARATVVQKALESGLLAVVSSVLTNSL